MQLKDYYKILNVPTNADATQIRKAFRTLALKYHPDKTQGDKHKEALFREVQEAYDVLSNPKSREEYHYKRWYTRSIGKSFVQHPSTPGMILRETTRLSEYVATGTGMHVDYDLLSSRIRNILSAENIAILEQFNEYETNSRIVRLLLDSMATLPLRYVEPIATLLVRVAGSDNELIMEISNFQKKRNIDTWWEKHTAWIVAGISLLICYLMYLYASNNQT